VKAEIERAIRARDKRVADSSHAEGFATALSARMKKAEAEILELGAKKEEAEVKANRLQVEMDKLQGEHDKLLQHNEQLKGSVSEHETALDQQEQAANEGQLAQQNLQMRVEALENELASAHAQGLQLAKNRDSLLAQLRNSKEVVARITADNLMFINKIKHCENKLEQAVREREMLRQDLNSNDSRWFEHLRDELQKLTTQHMAEKDAQEASVAEAKENIRGELEQAHARCEALEGELAENKDAYAALQRAADLGQQKLAALQEAHDDLQNKHHSTAQSHGSLSAEKQTLSETLEATRRDNTAKTNVIEELQKQLQGAARTVAEATSERDTMREEAERLSEEKEKQKDLNEIILKDAEEACGAQGRGLVCETGEGHSIPATLQLDRSRALASALKVFNIVCAGRGGFCDLRE
jgi:chromosome segregation ATPase